MSKEIIMWVDKEEFEIAVEMQAEARTITLPLHTFPIHHSDIPIKIEATSMEELGKQFLAAYPDWDKFL